MHTITMKVGELMTQAESMRNTENYPGYRSGKNHTFFGNGKQIIAMISRKFCIVALRFQLKDIGSSIRCEGKIKVTGTKNIKIGDKCKFRKNVQLKTEGRGYIHIGANVKIGKGVKIVSQSNVTIEDNTYLGDYITIRDSVNISGENQSGNGAKPVYIGKDAWIGKGTRIHAGITIGSSSTIASNSVVTKSVPPGVIAGGTPAKVIMDR